MKKKKGLTIIERATIDVPEFANVVKKIEQQMGASLELKE